tara:strand:+ start:11713 stop:12873 length:1161 start_codon:yes stop_codon:yes gene_type:complete
MNTVQEIINEFAAEIISVSKIAVTAERVFTEKKSCYLTREEFSYPTNIGLNRIAPSITSDQFEKNHAYDISDNNTNDEILNVYAPGRHGIIDKVNFRDLRTFQQAWANISPSKIQKLNALSLTNGCSPGFLDRDNHTEYIPLAIGEPSYLALKTCEQLHKEYYRQTDQAELDLQSFIAIREQISNSVNPPLPSNETYEAGFPLLAYHNRNIKPDSKDNDFKFIKIVLFRNSSVPQRGKGFSDTYIIRTYKTTRAKTTVKSITYITDWQTAYDRAKEMYSQIALSSKYCELYDIENINEYIREHVRPSDESYRFVPDGYFGEHSYIHDRDSNKYITVPEYKIKFRKDLAKKAKNAVKNGDKILEEKMKEISKNPEKYQEMKSFLMSL